MDFPAHRLNRGYSVASNYIALTFTSYFAQVYTDPGIISLHALHRA